MTALRYGAPLALLAMLVLGTASAQLPAPPPTSASLEVTVAPPTQAIGGSDEWIGIEVVYSYPPNTQTMELQVVVDAIEPGWFVAPYTGPVVVVEGPSPGGTYRDNLGLLVRHDGTPLAFQESPVAFRVVAPGDGRLVQAIESQQTVTVEAAYRAGLLVSASATGMMIPEKGGRGTIHGELVNTGNGATRVTTEVTSIPYPCTLTAIDPIVLAPGERQNLAETVTCEKDWEPGTLALRMSQEYAGTEATARGRDVVPVWDLVHGEGGSFGGSRSFGDASRDPRYESSWGATLLVPIALSLAALVVRRR